MAFIGGWKNHFPSELWQTHRLVFLPWCILDINGTKLPIEKTHILERWAEHFNSVLNQPASINNEVINRLPQMEISHELDNIPSMEEVSKAIKQTSSGKAPESDAIPAEVYKTGGTIMLHKLTRVFQSIWNESKVPQRFKDVFIVDIYKRNDNRRSCDNHRGISFLSTAGNILARVQLNRLTSRTRSSSFSRKSGWLPGKSRNGGHDLCCTSATGEVSGANHRAVHHSCRLNQSLWHGQQVRSVEDNEEVWVSKQDSHSRLAVSWRYDGFGFRRWQHILSFSSDQWCKARPRACANTLQYGVCCYVPRCLPEL